MGGEIPTGTPDHRTGTIAASSSLAYPLSYGHADSGANCWNHRIASERSHNSCS